MPFILFEDDLADAGSATLSGTQVWYVAWDVTAFGFRANGAGSIDDLALTQIGGFALGDSFDIVGGAAVERWHEFRWMNVQHGLWVPYPTLVGGVVVAVVATRVRWALSLDTTVHMRIFGES